MCPRLLNSIKIPPINLLNIDSVLLLALLYPYLIDPQTHD